MKILQVVALWSESGAYGGPTTVAIEQCKALARAGHSVTLVSAGDVDRITHGVIESEGAAVNSIRFPYRWISRALGFAGMLSVPLLRWVRGGVRGFDVVHVHLARDLITLPALLTAQAAGVATIAQTHGMIDTSKRRLAHALDIVGTRRALRHANFVASLTDQEDSEIHAVEPCAKVVRVANGVHLNEAPPVEDRKRQVMFLARLHERKRPLAFVEVARSLAVDFPDVDFLLCGPDEGEGAKVRQVLDQLDDRRIAWIGAVSHDQAQSLLAQSIMFLLPSRGEVFPMSLLEAFKAQVPAIVTDSLGVADDCSHFGAAIVTDGSVEQMAAAARSVLSDSRVASELVEGAKAFLEERLNIDRVAERLSDLYGTASQRDGARNA